MIISHFRKPKFTKQKAGMRDKPIQRLAKIIRSACPTLSLPSPVHPHGPARPLHPTSTPCLAPTPSIDVADAASSRPFESRGFTGIPRLRRLRGYDIVDFVFVGKNMVVLEFVYVVLLLFLGDGIVCLKDVVLEIDPAVVEKGGTSKLRCSYDLQGAPLYTVKWYRGTHEFYRYTPKELPSTKTFSRNGVNVDLQQSNEHQVVLKDVGFNLSGKFSCEVTTDAPHFSTKTVSKDMLVVVLPNSPPSISTDKTFYDIGDVLRANCSSSLSRPAATLTFILNNIVVCAKCNAIKSTYSDLFSVYLTLDLPLFESHFNGGRMILECVAKIGNLYQQTTEITFENDRDPVPAKVTANNFSAAKEAKSFYFMTFLIYSICVVQ